MRILETEEEKKSFFITAIGFLLLFLALYFLTTSNQIVLPVLEGGGGGGEIAVNFGNSDLGSGTNFESKEIVTAAPKEVVAETKVDKEILVSENEEAPAIAEVKKTIEKIMLLKFIQFKITQMNFIFR